jgi:hypothetical protein
MIGDHVRLRVCLMAPRQEARLAYEGASGKKDTQRICPALAALAVG